MDIVLNKKQLAMAIVSTMWSPPTTSELSGSDCIDIAGIDAGSGTGEILGASVRAATVASV